MNSARRTDQPPPTSILAGTTNPDRADIEPGSRNAADGNRNRTPRLAGGQLVALVLAHLQAHPGLDFTPYEVARALGGRSHGTIRRILLQLTDDGIVTRTSRQPARFRINTR